MRTDLQTLLDSQAVIPADGGMGTMLFAHRLPRDHAPELWNVERPEVVGGIHRAYIEAGAQVVLSNSFGGSRARLERHGLAGRAVELNEAAARLVRAAADAASQPVIAAGSIGPSGALLAPLGDLDFDQAVAIFAEQAGALTAGGVDVLWIETMSDLEEVRAAFEGCRRAAPALPCVTTMTFDTHGRTMMGTKPEQALVALRDLGAAALGANCGRGPDEIEAVIETMHAVDPSVVLVAKANAGLPRMTDGQAVYDATPERMADYARRVHALGARIIGACCGSTPDHIRAMASALRQATP
jgi:5-methyltetrahydrofolate--homocysteine methyltransferase